MSDSAPESAEICGFRLGIILPLQYGMNAEPPIPGPDRGDRAMPWPRPPSPIRRGNGCEGYRYQREIAEASAKYAVPARLIRAIIVAESGFDRARCPETGACAHAVDPETAAILGVRDPFDARQNITRAPATCAL